MTSNGLWWSRCVGICTDGAKAMTGRHSGVVNRVLAVAPDTTWVHCSIHREALSAKGRQSKMDSTVKMVNFVKARPLELSCIFCIMQWYGQRPCNAFTTYRSALVIKGQSIDTFFFHWETSLKFSLLTIIFTYLITSMMTSFSHDWPIWVMFFLTWMIWI